MALEFFESITSTNDYFKEKSQKGLLKKGDAVVAFSQTKGRGRVNRPFSSNEGGIYLTVSYGKVENTDVEKYYSLMPSSSLALSKLYLEALGIKTEIKWPNDILKNGKKCTGILAERTKEGDLILGVGINYDNVSFSEGLENIATSLYEGGEKPQYPNKDFAILAVNTLLSLKTFGEEPALLKEYEEFSTTIGKTVECRTTSGVFLKEGKAVGINEKGELLLRLADESLFICSVGEISLKNH